MSTLFIYRLILCMLALLTAKRIDKIAVGTDNVRSMTNHKNVIYLPTMPSMQQQLQNEYNYKIQETDKHKNKILISNIKENIKETSNLPSNQNVRTIKLIPIRKKKFANKLKIENEYTNLEFYVPNEQKPVSEDNFLKNLSTNFNVKNLLLPKPQAQHQDKLLQYQGKLPAMNAFNAFGGISVARQSNSGGGLSDSHPSCGGLLSAKHGIISTPNFPNKFPAPITCVWVIDASNWFEPNRNISIYMYLNQLYILGGLKFTEYMYYSDDYKVPSQNVFDLREDDVTQITWIQFQSQYLEIRFDMKTLDGTHLRVLDRFLDVYGFNVTYEIAENIKSYQCNALQCHFLGHCYAKKDFTSYYCSCFPSFSGVDCSKGPYCDNKINFCENGGTCKYIGDATVTCLCPKGFHGNQCEFTELTENSLNCNLEQSSKCNHLCLLLDPVTAMNNDCKCNTTKTSNINDRVGKTRFEVTIRLGTNLTTFYRPTENSDRKSGENNLSNLLEKHMNRVLKNFNITKVNDLELISNSSKRLDITFHFFGYKNDSNRIRDAITRMVERGRLGNFTLVSNYHLFDEDPPLQLQAINVNQKLPIRENTEFIVSCIAQGSPKLEFHWFKDGSPVNASIATRDIWSVVLAPEQENVYTSILGISKAKQLDQGIYSCKVIDWGVEQCKSIHIRIQAPPKLTVDPLSVTLHHGDSLRVRCLSGKSSALNSTIVTYSSHSKQRYGNFGYSWTRNGILFQSNPNSTMWEDLYPDGSILKINNIQKSAEYTCIVSNSIQPVSKGIYVTVIDKGIVELCSGEKRYGINWKSSAPGAPIYEICPKGYEGYSKRQCEQRDVTNSSWLEADFSQCKSNILLKIYDDFQTLTLGYQKTNCSTVLKSCLEYAMKRQKEFLPGESEFLMDTLQEVENYLKIKGTHLEREMAAEVILHILDKVMQNSISLNSQQQIKKFQLLTQSAALNRETIAASQLATSTSVASSLNGGISSSDTSLSNTPGGRSKSILINNDGSDSNNIINNNNKNEGLTDSALSFERLNSFRIYTTSMKALPFNLKIYGDDLFSDQLYLDIRRSKNLMNIMANGTIFASVISYKNLTRFLPKTYYSRGSDLGADYMPSSRIIATWLFQANRSNDNYKEPLNLPLESGHVEIIFQHDSIPKNTDWLPVCGYEMRSTFESTWRTDLCITKNLMENMTRCICPLSGTFVVLMARKNYNATITNRTTSTARPIFVIISCGCCFLQSCTAFAFLIPILYNRKCCITFLKMQFCTSTSTVMAIYLLGFLKLLPQDWHSIISSTLASLMLLGLSTLVAIPLVIQSELVPKKLQIISAAAAKSTNLIGKKCSSLKHQQQNQKFIQNSAVTGGIRGAIGISWLLPILFAITSPLIYSIIGKWPLYWWLEYPNSGFILFCIIELLFIGLFLLLFITLLKKLLWLLKKHDKYNASIWRRVGLLNRTGIILFLKLSTDSLFLLYLNTNGNFIISHIFGISCIILGIAILFCFIVKAELHTNKDSSTISLKKTSTKTSLDENFCTGSINSPLNFYASHEKEKENESSPLQLTIISTSHCQSLPSTVGQTIGTTKSTVETFLGVVNSNQNSATGTTNNGSSYVVGNDKILGNCDISLHEMEQIKLGAMENRKTDTQINTGSGSGSGTKSRCCNILGTSGGGGSVSSNSSYDSVPVGSSIIGFYDSYHHQNNGISAANGMQSTKCTLPENHEFVGVETLDILQGVSPDSIIGIRVTSLSSATTITGPTSTILNTNSIKTQTPKSQKRVTIIDEPKTKYIKSGHTIQHQPPLIVTQQLPPIIKITSTSSVDSENDSNSTISSGGSTMIMGPNHSIIQSNMNSDNLALNNSNNLNNNQKGDSSNSNDNDSDDKIDGMLDRISHDLDYLLNRTSEIPATPSTSTTIQSRKNSTTIHDIIIEESEQECN